MRRTLRTRLALLSDRQRARLEAVFTHDDHVAISVTWLVHFACYGDDELFIGGHPSSVDQPDVTVELSDW
ncbi:hypothetical protein LWC33_02955 [Pseudonocardia sp. RS11V-5]|uniref:hypothetical protein n=1 Tax=Pseudonocardia terrae TaxID=2905831 RepID=UPI001E500B34|nr:hypothetical protein [Pseudonocardia terrae]MCE3550414.1 hypothetical protein [Pseudonocardia terrae]